MVEPARESDQWVRPEARLRGGWSGFAASLHGWIERGRRASRRAEEAHDRLRRSQEVSDETAADLGLGREAILGEPSWQADLPFFMQRGFR